jgi:hypothetical protein
MKKIMFLIGALALFCTDTIAQEVDLKKDQVFVDGKPVYSYDRGSLEFHLYKLGTTDELIYVLHNNNSTQKYMDDDYKKIVFVEKNVIVENSLLRGRSKKYIIELLLKEKVLDLEGNIDETNLQKFVTKYDEGITKRTIRH